MLGTAQAEAFASLEHAREPCGLGCVDEAAALLEDGTRRRSAGELAGLCRAGARTARAEGEQVRACLLDELAATLAELLDDGK